MICTLLQKVSSADSMKSKKRKRQDKKINQNKVKNTTIGLNVDEPLPMELATQFIPIDDFVEPEHANTKPIHAPDEDVEVEELTKSKIGRLADSVIVPKGVL